MNKNIIFLILITLFILLFGCPGPTICGDGICDTRETKTCDIDCGYGLIDARQTIGNALSANSYGVLETGTFQIEDGDTIRASQLSSKADECSFYFDASLFPDSQIMHNENADSETCDSYIKNLSSSPVKARASVICESTIEELQDSLETAGFENLTIAPTDFFIEADVLFNKMCVVVLKEAN